LAIRAQAKYPHAIVNEAIHLHISVNRFVAMLTVRDAHAVRLNRFARIVSNSLIFC
jgi:hypothetical protein